MRHVDVYMSSTDFSEKPDSEWKERLRKSCEYELHHMFDDKWYSFHCYDPLKVISDKAEIVTSDIQHIIKSDFVVCYLPATKLTIGTLMELQYSCINKPSDCVILIDPYKIHRNHPWIKYWVKHVVDNEDEATDVMLNILGKPDFTNLKEGRY